MIDSAVTDLPQPDSPTTPSVPRSGISNDTPSTARTVPALGAELGDELLDLEQRHAAAEATASATS